MKQHAPTRRCALALGGLSPVGLAGNGRALAEGAPATVHIADETGRTISAIDFRSDAVSIFATPIAPHNVPFAPRAHPLLAVDDDTEDRVFSLFQPLKCKETARFKVARRLRRSLGRSLASVFTSGCATITASPQSIYPNGGPLRRRSPATVRMACSEGTRTLSA